MKSKQRTDTNFKPEKYSSLPLIFIFILSSFSLHLLLKRNPPSTKQSSLLFQPRSNSDQAPPSFILRSEMKIEDPTRFVSLMRRDRMGGSGSDEMEGMGLVLIAADLVPLMAVWSWWL
ncbi:hypothetical protein Ddye_008215 [Dipteronia dyeriana]|uniref:Transmembrane protein n=1 Tax=Dipteronia dyeriana TaxID=168575 RepID=A0AAD9X9X7_9ROSI|nr:hypothetical protein Ddye_008215 [Dipteronia dyeriana]